ncbi:MAG: ROK family protein [Ignavibacteria bacterium]|nr:ROK family protein [Ignavibacteria bacterium]
MKNNCIISIDMGGTKILTAAVNSTDGIFARVKHATKVTKGKINYAQNLAEAVRELQAEAQISDEQIKAISLGVPGSVNPGTGVISLAPNLGLKNYNLKRELEKQLPYPVLLENDVNLGALGIMHSGMTKGIQNALVVFIGTGIGGALIFNNKLYRGNTFTAGEIGHLHILDNGPVCGCGKHGCFEAIASRTAITRDITAEIKLGKRSKLAKLVKNKTQIKSKALATAVTANDPLAIRHLTKAAQTTGKVLASINNLLNLDMIILGGGVIEAVKGFYIPIIKESFHEYSLAASAKNTKILPSKLLDDAPLFGGLMLAEEFLDMKI